MEYLVKDSWSATSEVLGVTQSDETAPRYFSIIWDNGVISHPWLECKDMTYRYIIVKEFTDEEAQNQLLVWKIKNGIRI